jgi:hypothetical protein
VAIDYGIAIFPEDGQDAASLFASADKALYASKHRAHSPSEGDQPPSKEATPEIEEPPPEVESEADSGDPSRVQSTSPFVSPMEAEAEARTTDSGPSGRKIDRIRLEGTPALGVVRVGGKRSTVRVLDMSSGGVCLLVDQVDLPKSFPARLHVPLAPEGELTLHRVYSLLLPEGKQRVGCSFTPLAEPQLV